MENNYEMKRKCSFCSEDIPIDTSRCPYCGSILEIIFDAPIVDVEISHTGSEFEHNQNISEVLMDFQYQESNEQSDFTNERTSTEEPSISNVVQKDSIKNSERSYNITDEKPSNVNRYSETKIIEKRLLGNGFKVFLTIICTLIPGFGQMLGIIMGIIYMNNDDEVYGADKRSFGLALLIASIGMFVFTCFFWFIILLAMATPFNQ